MKISEKIFHAFPTHNDGIFSVWNVRLEHFRMEEMKLFVVQLLNFVSTLHVYLVVKEIFQYIPYMLTRTVYYDITRLNFAIIILHSA